MSVRAPGVWESIATGLVCDSPQFLVQSLVSSPAAVQVGGVVTVQLSIQLCPSAAVNTASQTVHTCAVTQVASAPGVWPSAAVNTTPQTVHTCAVVQVASAPGVWPTEGIVPDSNSASQTVQRISHLPAVVQVGC